MKKKIYQLAREEFDSSFAALILQQDCIREETEEGKSAAGELLIRNSDNREMKGVLYAKAPFIRLKENAFLGTEASIGYELLSLDRRAGEELTGEICLVTSCGECRIEVSLLIKEAEEKKKKRNLLRLANLAKKDWPAAVEQYKELYPKRRGGGPASQELEEFLIDGGKKQKIILHTDRASFSYETIGESFADSLSLKKDGWGYIKINVWSDTEFLQPEHKVIWSDNFIGDAYTLEFLLKKEKLHAGKNYGRIYIKTIHQLLTVEVCAVCKGAVKEKVLTRRQKEAELVFIHNYFRYQSGLLEQAVYAREGLVWRKENLGAFLEEESQLLEIYFMALNGQKALAEDLLKDVNPRNTLQRAAVSYLRHVCSRSAEEKERELSNLRGFYKEREKDSRILCFLLQTAPEFLEDPEKRFLTIEEHNSKYRPATLLYPELIKTMNERPPLLKHLTPSLVKAVNWGIQMDVVSPQIKERYVFLAANEEEVHLQALKGLKELYRQEGSDEVLQAILRIMVRKNCLGSRYFRWYEKGIRRQLRIKNLYEAYLCSAEERPGFAIPKAVLTYFAYDNQLPDDVKELLYSYIIQHKREEPETYLSYFPLLEQFALKRLSQKALNHRLTVIYQEILKPERLDGFYLRKLSKLLFRQELICSNKDMTGVYICHKELSEEEYFPLEDGRAEVYLFTEKPVISFADGSGCRYGEAIEYRIEGYLDCPGWEKECYRVDAEYIRLLLYLYEKIRKRHKFDEEANEIRRRVQEIPELQREYQTECRIALIHQYFDKMEEEPLKELLLKLSPEMAAEEERPKLIDYCILQGLDEQAYTLIKSWGYKGIPQNRLLWLVCRLLEKIEGKDELLLSICFYLLERGRSSPETLTYLALYYEGLLGQLHMVWKKAQESGLETWPIEERLLAQLLFTEGSVEDSVKIFGSYYRKKGDMSLVRAYLNFYAYQYFVKGESISEEFFQFLPEEIDREYSRILALAYLQYKSREEELDARERQQVERYLRPFLYQNEIFPCFKGFQGKLLAGEGILDRTFIEYRCAPGRKVSLSFRFEEGEEFKTVPMVDLGYGIYAAGFLLFSYETLEYYITELREEGDITGERQILAGGNRSGTSKNSDFGLLESILLVRQAKDDKAMEGLMEEYILQKYRKDKLFTIL